MTMQTSAQTPPRPDEKQAIRALTEKWLAAVHAKDTAQLLTMVTDDAVFIPLGRPPIRGKKEIEAMYQLFFSQFSDVAQTVDVDEVEIAGDWAFTWGSEKMVLFPKSGGPAMQLEGKGMSILRRQPDGSWKFARGINNDVPSKP